MDEFIANVRPYVFVRTEDNLLIRRPNQAQKLNREGAVLLKMLLRGSPLRRVLARVGPDPRRLEDVALFLHDVRRWLEGRLDATHRTRATEIVPLELHFSKLPVLAEIAVTYRCNLRCAFCYAGCNGAANPIGDGREMTAAEIRTVLERIYRDAKVPSVSFTGGEPTLRPELPALVRFAADLGLRVNLITNATRVTAALAAELANAGLASAQASLEGVTAGTHERLTGSPGSFARTLAGVAHLRAAGIRVHTNTTLNRANLGEAPRVPAFVRRILGLERFSMNLVIPAGSAALNARLVVRYTELGPHLEAIQRAAQAEDVEFMWYSPTPMCLFNPVAHGLGNKGCSACDGLLSVAANGDVLPCSCCDDPVGNLLREDATAIWQSATARRYRDKGFAHPACRGCADFSICHGACPLYWRQLGFGELAVRRDAPAAGKECPVP
ncbi:MAG: radical SAM protein [Planctomycetes bacterium]|nr:radical SAM protein [Planctomycetota bacterium]